MVWIKPAFWSTDYTITEQLEVSNVLFQEPPSPTFIIVLKSSNGKPLGESTDVFIAADGLKMIIDTKEADISFPMGFVLAVYRVFNLAYPCQLKKFFFGGLYSEDGQARLTPPGP